MERRADATVYETAYAEAVRALSEQHGVIESLRTRAGLLLSSAAVTTSFLGGQAIHGGQLSVLAWLALVSFVAVAVLAIAILQPRRWELGTNPDEPFRAYFAADENLSGTELFKALITGLDWGIAANRAVLERLAVLLQLAGSLLALEVVIWVVAIASVT